MPGEKVYNYPNPNSQDVTYIHFYLREDADVRLFIFDLAGDLVKKLFIGRKEGMRTHEIPWDLSGVASGVYLCHIEAKSSIETETQIIKIMVIH